jgi:hypothetical protein
MGVRKMKAKQIISLLVGVAFITAFAVCPTLAASDDLSGQYIAAPKEHNLISGTLDYLGSVVNVFSKGTWKTFDNVMDIPPKCCEKRVAPRPVMVMNRGGRWRRGY